ncbi:unnamed protein product [Aspergillus oryzae RIB40]|uniref:DNA, SC012 n=1 Tax=Aspergillus oryzae (strain ATCC 42149 / RIB 40) TaxID=510516 RepID=Q2UDL7_ASPOR|nr:unnamed protein product [Aspergillus oryzae RIB40]BAE60348.1 unnamed protein product [Aspergillus oryzae RIB40]
MSFHQSCDLIRIEVRGDHTVLLAAAKNGDGDETVPAEIVLDEQIGNGDGWFVRGGENFTETAHEIELEFREDGPWLTAFLTEVDGEDRERQGINLADHIGNDCGRLVWAQPQRGVPHRQHRKIAVINGTRPVFSRMQDAVSRLSLC